MKNKSQLTIVTMLFVLIITLTSCALEQGTNSTSPDIQELSEEDSELIEAIIGEPFYAVYTWDSQSRKVSHFARKGTDTIVKQTPVAILEFEAATSYTVIGVTLDDNNHSLCNVVKIDGQPEDLICKNNIDAIPLSTNANTNRVASNIPTELVEQLSFLAATKDEIGFFTIFGNESKQIKLIPNLLGGYESVSGKLDSISSINEIRAEALAAYRRNPCCTIDANGVEHCQQICI